MQNTGTLFIVSAPSGAGKTSLVKALVARVDKVVVSISYTTRLKRDLEEHGKDYYFVTESTFQAMIQQNEFIEHANVYGYYYGTSQCLVEQELNKNNDVILEIDWQGATQIHAKYPEAVRIFILPPSIDVLRERLIQRGQDSLEVIGQRMAKAADNMAHSKDYEYVVINDDFEQAVAELVAIVQRHRLKRTGGFGAV